MGARGGHVGLGGVQVLGLRASWACGELVPGGVGLGLDVQHRPGQQAPARPARTGAAEASSTQGHRRAGPRSVARPVPSGPPSGLLRRRKDRHPRSPDTAITAARRVKPPRQTLGRSIASTSWSRGLVARDARPSSTSGGPPQAKEQARVRHQGRPRHRRCARGADGHDGHQGLGAVRRRRRRDRGAGRRASSRTSPTSSPTATRSRAWPIDSPDGRDILRHSTAHVMAQAVQELCPEARLGIGPPIENGFYYDFDVESPFIPEDLEQDRDPDAQDHQGGPAVLPARGLRRTTRSPSSKDEPYKLELIGLKGAGHAEDAAEGAERRGRRRRADHLRQPPPQRRGGLERPVPRPAPADHQADPGVQADAHRGGVLARRREEQAAPAHLRHRLGVQGGARGRTCTGSRRPSGATTASSAATSTSTPSPTSSAPGLAVFHPKGGVIKREMEDYVRQRHIEEGFAVRRHPAHHQGRAVPHLGAPAVLRRHACSRPWRWRAPSTASRR